MKSTNLQGEYIDPSLTTLSPEKRQRDLNASPLAYHAKEVQVRPKLLEKGLASNGEFQNLSPGFQRVFSEDKADQAMKLPVVGYCGHRKGEKAENMFAKNYRDTTL